MHVSATSYQYGEPMFEQYQVNSSILERGDAADPLYK